jgi:hypothetical protein
MKLSKFIIIIYDNHVSNDVLSGVLILEKFKHMKYMIKFRSKHTDW